MKKLLQLHPDDNVFIVIRKIVPGDAELIKGALITFDYAIELGHKVSARLIKRGERIIKYGVPVGSAIEAIKTGAHIHIHNMKSDYIPTFSINDQFEHKQ